MRRRKFLTSMGLIGLAMPFMGLLFLKRDKPKEILDRVIITGSDHYDGEYVIRPFDSPMSGRWELNRA